MKVNSACISSCKLDSDLKSDRFIECKGGPDRALARNSFPMFSISQYSFSSLYPAHRSLLLVSQAGEWLKRSILFEKLSGRVT